MPYICGVHSTVYDEHVSKMYCDAVVVNLDPSPDTVHKDPCCHEFLK